MEGLLVFVLFFFNSAEIGKHIQKSCQKIIAKNGKQECYIVNSVRELQPR